MPKKKNIKSSEKRLPLPSVEIEMAEETKMGIFAVVSFIMASFLTLAALGNAGFMGKVVFNFLYKLFGTGFFLFPATFFLIGISFLKTQKPKIVTSNFLGGAIFLLGGLATIDIIFRTKTSEEITGGAIGFIISFPLIKLFGVFLSTIILTAIVVISILIIFNTKITLTPTILGKRLWGESEWNGDEESIEENQEQDAPIQAPVDVAKQIDSSSIKKDSIPKESPESKEKTDISEKIQGFIPNFYKKKKVGYTYPPLSLLEQDSEKPSVGDIKGNANIIKRTLLNFGIDVEMDEISIGPSVTRYAFKPAEGVRLSKIISLQNDLALALAAHPIRIEAPIPGKSLVGVEIPNTVKATVRLGTLLSAKKFSESDKPLLIGLGKGTSGIPHFADLAKAPHLLIAGSTGSGKSVTMHSIIASLLYRNSPENLRFVMIDPKRVELTLYNGIPHLLTPVITEPKKAILVLKWLTKEMERRYNILEEKSVRDIQSYHQNIFEKYEKDHQGDDSENETPEDKPERMPYIVVVVDELADIMTSYPKELESSIVRIAQMSRAVGIHLILSTQRPSVEVITGLIKANIPSRIALQVPSQIDSRTIIDMQGAEKLLGAGDMLYLSGDMAKPHRIQSAFISETEVKKVSDYLKKNAEDKFDNGEIDFSEVKDRDVIFSQNLEDSLGDDDALSQGEDEEIYENARDLVIKTGKASTSYLQRRLKLGYARAARIMDMLEEQGVVGPAEGSKPREVYIKHSQELDEETDENIVLGDKDTNTQTTDKEEDLSEEGNK